jgi:hypothetical protein
VCARGSMSPLYIAAVAVSQISRSRRGSAVSDVSIDENSRLSEREALTGLAGGVDGIDYRLSASSGAAGDGGARRCARCRGCLERCWRRLSVEDNLDEQEEREETEREPHRRGSEAGGERVPSTMPVELLQLLVLQVNRYGKRSVPVMPEQGLTMVVERLVGERTLLGCFLASISAPCAVSCTHGDSITGWSSCQARATRPTT